MNKEQREELRQMAYEATPGPWLWGSFGRLLVVPADVDGRPNKWDTICDLGEQEFPSTNPSYANAPYIAAANPQAITALLDALEAAEKALTQPEEKGIVPPDSIAALKLAMKCSAWDGKVELSDVLANIDDFAEYPQQSQPLTDEQIQDVVQVAIEAGELAWLGFRQNDQGEYRIPILSQSNFQLVRAIEAAHNIKGATE